MSTGLGTLRSWVTLLVLLLVLFSGAFVVETFGFNERGLGLWLRDWLVRTPLSLALLVPLGVAVVWFVTGVPLWPVAAWALATGAILVFMSLKPRVIDPLFYEFEALDEGSLKEDVVVAVLWALLASGVVCLVASVSETPYVGLFVGLLVLGPVTRLTRPLENYISLQYERGADA